MWIELHALSGQPRMVNLNRVLDIRPTVIAPNSCGTILVYGGDEESVTYRETYDEVKAKFMVELPAPPKAPVYVDTAR